MKIAITGWSDLHKLTPIVQDSTYYHEVLRDFWDYVKKNEVFRHYKGGYYRKLMEGKETDHAQDVVIYEHLYPHERGVWVRDKVEFYSEGRFERIEP